MVFGTMLASVADPSSLYAVENYFLGCQKSMKFKEILLVELR